MEDSTVLRNLTVVSQGCLQNLARDTQQVVEGQVDCGHSTDVTLSQQECWSFVPSDLSTASFKLSCEADRLIAW